MEPAAIFVYMWRHFLVTKEVWRHFRVPKMAAVYWRAKETECRQFGFQRTNANVQFGSPHNSIFGEDFVNGGPYTYCYSYV